MDSDLYTALTGIPVTSANQAAITAAIRKTKAILENLLGYSLSDQSGASDRDFPYYQADTNKLIDPCTAVHSVKVIKNGDVLETLDSDEYTVITNRGIKKYFKVHQCPICHQTLCACDNPLYEYRVNADWCFADGALPDDLAGVWADMVTYYSDPKILVKSETLGTHSYSQEVPDPYESDPANQQILRRYAGARGELGILPV